jgi:hypothetical protein
MMKHAKLVEDAKRDPSRIYTNPLDVLRDRRLSNLERIEILATWERDARALSVASDEAMGGGEPNRLSEVIEARKEAEKRLPGGAAQTHDHTKFGGDETGAEDD